MQTAGSSSTEYTMGTVPSHTYTMILTFSCQFGCHERPVTRKD